MKKINGGILMSPAKGHTTMSVKKGKEHRAKLAKRFGNLFKSDVIESEKK